MEHVLPCLRPSLPSHWVSSLPQPYEYVFEFVTECTYVIDKKIKVQRGEGTGWRWYSQMNGSIGTRSQVSSLSGGLVYSSSVTKRLFPESLSNSAAAGGRHPFSLCSAFSTCRWQLSTELLLSDRDYIFPKPLTDSDAAHSISSCLGYSLGILTYRAESMWTTQNK